MLHIIYISLYNKISKRRNSPKITEKKLFIWFEKKEEKRKENLCKLKCIKKFKSWILLYNHVIQIKMKLNWFSSIFGIYIWISMKVFFSCAQEFINQKPH